MSDTSNIDSNSIIAGYSSANELYNNVDDNLKYKEIVQDYSKNPTLVDIGCICNTEYSSFNFNALKYWNSDTPTPNIQNAQKIINDLEWMEQSNMHSGKIKTMPGMVILTKPGIGYKRDDVSFFDDIASNVNSPTEKFNTFMNANGNKGTAIDLFGYFIPDVTGTWTFSIPCSDPTSELYTYLWVGDTALYEYKASNANINSNSPVQNNGKITASFKFNRLDCIPFRIQFISVTANYTGENAIFSIIPPDNSLAKGFLTSNSLDNWRHFVTFVKDGNIYYKNILYFGLVQSNKEANKYDCFFINTESENARNIRSYKQNPQLQYFRTEIPIPMEGKGTLQASDGDPVNLSLPYGVVITITSATYGLTSTYSHDVYKPGLVPSTTSYPSQTKTIQVDSKDNYIPTKPETITSQAVTRTVMVDGMVFDKTITTKRIKDVKQTLQELVNSNGGNKIQISGGSNNFLNVFGNPIEYDKDPARESDVKKKLTVEYTFKIDETKVRETFLYLDPETAQIIVGFTFNDNNIITVPMPMDKMPSCSNKNCGNYKMALLADGRLVVINDNNEMGFINMFKYLVTRNPKFTQDICKVNPNWLGDPNIISLINAGVATKFSNGNRLKSTDGRFKLEFEKTKLIFTYCIIPYTTLNTGLRYTTTFNINNTNNGQIYYLYRINTRGMIGRKFLNEKQESTGITTLHYLPNSHTNILYQSSDPNSFIKMLAQPAYPLMKDGNLAFPQNYNNNTTGAKTYTACASQCLSEPNNGCEHFFFLTNSDNTSRCYTDKVSDSNPGFTTTQYDSKIKNSDIYKKPYKIKSTGGSTVDYQDVYRLNSNMVGDAGIDYRIPENAPNLTYIYSLDGYKEDNYDVLGTYSKGYDKQGFTTLKEGLESQSDVANTASATSETQYGPYAPYVTSHITKKFPILNTLTKSYSKVQDKVGDQYDETINQLRQYDNVLNSMKSPQYKFNGTDSLIPDRYRNDQNPKPSITFTDGAKKDVGVMLMQQNNMYIVASITAATCLILGIAFAGNSE